MKYLDSEDVNDYMFNLPNMLCDYLNAYLSKVILHHPITIQSEDLLLKEIFSYDGLLGLFLLEEQNNIANFVEQLNKNHNENYKKGLKFSLIKSYIHIVFWPDDSSLIDIAVGLEHNLNKEESRSFIVFLANSILNNKNLEIVDNKVALDKLYKKFFDKITEIIKVDQKVKNTHNI